MRRLLALLVAIMSLEMVLPQENETDVYVRNEDEFVAAVMDPRVLVVRLATSIRLSPYGWPSSPVTRTTNFTIIGGPTYPLLDMAFLERKVGLAPGVTWTFIQIELRNVRQRAGFEVDLFAESGGATVIYDDIVYHCLSCLPVRLLMQLIPTLPRLPGDGDPERGGFIQNMSLGPRSWCRTGQPALASCYRQPNLFVVHHARALLVAQGLAGLSNVGGYVLVGRQVVFVCEEPVSDECGLSLGYDICVRSKIRAMYERDTTWDLLAANLSAGEGATGGAQPLSTALVAGIAAGTAVAVLLAAAALTVAVRRRQRRRRQLQGGKGPAAQSADAPQQGGAEDQEAAQLEADLAKGGGGGGDDVGADTGAKGSVQASAAADLSLSLADHTSPDSSALPLPLPPTLPHSRSVQRCVEAAVPTVALSVAAAEEEAAVGAGAGAEVGAASGAGSAKAAALAMRCGPAAAVAAGGAGGSGSGKPQYAAASTNSGSGSGVSTGMRSPQHHNNQQQQQQRGPAGSDPLLKQGAFTVAGITVDLMAPLGSGSFGKVYQGSWQGRTVAVKVLQYGAELCRAVHNEMVLGTTLRHDHVVASLHFVEVGPGGRVGQRASQDTPTIVGPPGDGGEAFQTQSNTTSGALVFGAAAGEGGTAGRSGGGGGAAVFARASQTDSVRLTGPNAVGGDSSSRESSAPLHPGGTRPGGRASALALALAMASRGSLHQSGGVGAATGGDGSHHGFLVMELCEGGSAEAWRHRSFRNPGQAPDMVVIQMLALHISRGMAYIHAAGACHGDLKLSNVLLSFTQGASSYSQIASGSGLSAAAASRSNSRGAVAAAAASGSGGTAVAGRRTLALCAKVCDFGLARVLGADATHVSTRPHGTATHLAPEVWAQGHVSQKADVYAFGITLWELATGERPWRGLAPGAILHRVMIAAGRPPLPLWLPPAYAQLLVECWAQSPEDRPGFFEISQRLALT